MSHKSILDACCGGRMMWFDKNNKDTLFVDKRTREKGFFKLRPSFAVLPDMQADFRDLPFEDASFSLVVFDPPHTIRKVEEDGSVMAQRYGRLFLDTWQVDLAKGLAECWRVLKPQGTLIFKWAECDKKIEDIEPFYPSKPLFGSRVGMKNKTLWIVFFKI